MQNVQFKHFYPYFFRKFAYVIAVESIIFSGILNKVINRDFKNTFASVEYIDYFSCIFCTNFLFINKDYK